MWFGRDFDAVIDRFSTDPATPIALAVSGGGDSVALLCLANLWAKQRGRTLVIFTVDHGLRRGSANEAAAVSTLCKSMGWRHETLTWSSPRPSQSAARMARYQLLADAMQRVAARALLTGHSFDDVVETAMIRRRRGVRSASIAGPSLAAPMPIWPSGRGLTLLRPLVLSRRHDLRLLCGEFGVEWAEDPSNENPIFERVRVRQFLRRYPRLSNHAATYVARLQQEYADDLAKLGAQLSRVGVREDGVIDTAGAAPTTQLISVLARCAAGTDRDPRADAVQRMLRSLSEAGGRQTLGGAWFQRTRTGYLIGRDPAPKTGPLGSDLFDGRYVRDAQAELPGAGEMSVLVRQSAPPDLGWREIISDRLAHLQLCYQTPLNNPVQR